MSWARWPGSLPLLLSGASAAGWLIWGPRGRRLEALTATLLLLGTVLGFSALRSPDPGRGSGGDLEEAVHAALSRRFERVVEDGDRALRATLDLLSTPGSDLQSGLSRVRRRNGVTALAVYDLRGRPRAWVGVHRGQVPQPIRLGDQRYAFGGGPLARYLYFTAEAPGEGGTVVAAVLLQADLPGGLEGGGFAHRFQNETGVPIRVLPPDRARGAAIWDLRWEDQDLLSVALDRPDAGTILSRGGSPLGAVLPALAALAWALLAVGGRGAPWHRSCASITLVAGALLLPAREVFPPGVLSSPAHFLLPGFPGGTLGSSLLLLAALAVVVGFTTPLRGPSEAQTVGGRWITGALVATLFPLLSWVYAQAPAQDLFAAGVGGWTAFQAGLALLLSLAAFAALALGAQDQAPSRPRRWALASGLLLSAILGLCAALVAKARPGLPPGALLLWSLPAAMVASGSGRRTRGGVLLLWLSAAILGSTSALPMAWGVQIGSRMHLAEAQLQELGVETDPFLEFRLTRMAAVADSLDRIVSDPVELLYETWAHTGPREEPIPMWLTLWSPGGLPGEDLAMGVRAARPPVGTDYLDQAREEQRPIIEQQGWADARYLLVVPLEGGRVMSAVVPPRGSLALAAPLGPVFAAWGRRQLDPPRLVPAAFDDPVQPGESVSWERTREGWRGRRVVSFEAEGVYYASQTVVLPGNLHMLARGTLTLVLDLVLALLFWGLGHLMGRGGEIRLREAARVLGTFRARVTVALFAFFLLSVAIFGTLAFQTLSGAAQNAASALADRIVEDGATFYMEAQGSMQLLSQEVGADLLEYRDGELAGGSSPELVRLGLYEGWIPEPVFRALEARETVSETRRSALGRWDYVMAYRRLPDGDVLATPVPVEAGETALRRQEVADILGFAIVLGAALSLGLALLVGRTLTRPIETLQVASERVGSGNLRVRLPEDRGDEFGAVFKAFNRMVQRIRRARRALVRTTRRTRTIVGEAATGVVALDGSGRVTLANPRAEALLGETIQVGESLPGREGSAAELVRWVDLYFRDGLAEGNTELQMGARRIRLRARRIPGEEPLGGAVLSLEDVTDELRSERVLAWGEMARQVAHEVKNPLTPMKLSIQHLQRAWEDGRPDFGEILRRNVEVILREIDRLAAIARSFSRFAAPESAAQTPLEPVSIHRAAEEVMNLYRGGTGALAFRCTVSPDLPLVRSRESELREVLINLLENSRAAIPEEGEVVIEADYGPEEVGLQVRDDGTGIAPELLPRIFEPHFSTRSTGTGLGLAIVRRLVESWGGGVTVESRVGKGTVIRITLSRWTGAEESGDLAGGAGEEPWS